MKKLLLIVLAVFLQAGSMFAQSIYDSLIVFTMELDSVVVTAKSRGFYQDMTKRDKKDLIERFKARVKADFPQEKNTYNILTDLFVGRDNQTVVKGKLKGELTVIPNASYKKGEDSIRVEGKLVSGYVNEHIAAEMEKLVAEKLSEKDTQEDGEMFWEVHKQIWGNNPYSVVEKLYDSPSSWSFIDNGDGTAFFAYRDKMGFLGIAKMEDRINFLVNSKTLELLSMVHESIIYLKIPFGGKKLDEEELDLLNSVKVSGEKFESFKVKTIDYYSKRFANYENKKPVQKAVEHHIKIMGDMDKVMTFSINGNTQVEK